MWTNFRTSPNKLDFGMDVGVVEMEGNMAKTRDDLKFRQLFLVSI